MAADRARVAAVHADGELLGEGARGELDILAVRWEAVSEGHKLYLWVKT